MKEYRFSVFFSASGIPNSGKKEIPPYTNKKIMKTGNYEQIM